MATHAGYGDSSVVDGRQTVTTAGTEVALTSTSTLVHCVDITAETDNTDRVVIGASTVVAALSTRRGTPLSAGDTHTLYDVNLKDIYIDALVDTEGVTYTAVKK